MALIFFFDMVHEEVRAGEAKNNSGQSLGRVEISHMPRFFAVSQNKLKSNAMKMGR